MPQEDKPNDITAWALGTAAFSTLLISGPVLGFLLTPLIPVIAVGMAAPFLFRAFAFSQFRRTAPGQDRIRRFRTAQTLATVAGAIIGVPLWWSILDAFLDGRYV